MVGRKSLRATGSMRFELKTKRVMTKPQQLFMAVLTSFSKFVEGLPIQRILKYMTLFWAELLKDGKLSNFLGNLSVDDIFRIAIVQ